MRAMLAVTPARASSSAGVAPLRRQDGQAAEALDAAQAGGALDHLEPVEEPRRAVVAAAEIQAHHAAKAAHLTARRWRDRDATRGPDSRRARLGRARSSAVASASALAFWRADAYRERLQSPAERVGGVRIEDGADELASLEYLLDDLGRSGEHAGGHVAVAVEILGRAVHDDVDAERQRLLIDRAGERVVDDRHDSARATGRGHRGNVDTAQRRVDRRLEPDQLRLGREDRVGLAQTRRSSRTAAGCRTSAARRRGGGGSRRRWRRCRRFRRHQRAAPEARWSWRPDRLRTRARSPRLRARRSSPPPPPRSGSRSASTGTWSSVLRCNRALPARSRRRNVSSRKWASSAARHRSLTPSARWMSRVAGFMSALSSPLSATQSAASEVGLLGEWSLCSQLIADS